MNQKIEDLKFMVKNDRRVWFAGGAIVLCILVVSAFGGAKPGQQQRGQFGTTEQQTVNLAQSNTVQTTYDDLITSFRSQVDKVNSDNVELKSGLDRIAQDFSSYKQESSGVFENLVDRVENLHKEIDQLNTTLQDKSMGGGGQPVVNLNGQQMQQYDANGNPLPPQDMSGVETFGMSEPTVPPPPAPLKPVKSTVISPGDSVKVRLLTGVNAPTDGSPYPVVFQLDGLITGPDGVALDLGEARLVAAATGSEVDNRAIFRITNISIRQPDGRRTVVKVDGWVVGEDGIRGMQGKIIDKLGRLIAATGTVSFASAIGDSLLNNSSSALSLQRQRAGNSSSGFNVINGDVQFGAATALNDMSSRLSQVLMNRYENLVPVIEVLSGREGVAVFSQTAEVNVMDDELSDESMYRTASLD